MKFKRAPRREEPENMLPLINVVFLMLIFFMLAGALTAADPFEVLPPSSVSVTETDQQEHVLLVGDQGALAFNGEPLARDAMGDALRAWLKENPDGLLRLKADLRGEAVALIEIMENVRKAGVERLLLLTLLPEETVEP